MIRLIAIGALALSLAVSAQAAPVAPMIAQPDSMITEIAAACGAGRTRVNGVCVNNRPANPSSRPQMCDRNDLLAWSPGQRS